MMRSSMKSEAISNGFCLTGLATHRRNFCAIYPLNYTKSSFCIIISQTRYECQYSIFRTAKLKLQTINSLALERFVSLYNCKSTPKQNNAQVQ